MEFSFWNTFLEYKGWCIYFYPYFQSNGQPVLIELVTRADYRTYQQTESSSGFDSTIFP